VTTIVRPLSGFEIIAEHDHVVRRQAEIVKREIEEGWTRLADDLCFDAARIFECGDDLSGLRGCVGQITDLETRHGKRFDRGVTKHILSHASLPVLMAH
jgi:hypothetical protein